jgi:hypothetical protein
LGSAERIIEVLEERGYELINRHYLEHSSLQSSSQLDLHRLKQQHQQNLLRLLASKDSLIKIASSELVEEISLWQRCFPELIQYLYSSVSSTSVMSCLSDIVSRLITLNSSITQLSDSTAIGKNSSSNSKWSSAATSSALPSLFSSSTSISGLLPIHEIIINQWKTYLIFSCIAIETVSDAKDKDPLLAGDRKPPKFIFTARALFNLVVPLLSCERPLIRKIVVTSLSMIHWRSFKTLMEVLQPYIITVLDDTRSRSNRGKLVATPSAVVRKQDHIRVEITHLMSSIACFMKYGIYRRNEQTLRSFITVGFKFF